MSNRLAFVLSIGFLISFNQSSYSQDQILVRTLDDLISYSYQTSLTIENNTIASSKAKKAKLAAVLGTIDIQGSLLSAQFTDNTTLGVNLFPSEIFGGEPGTFQEVQTGVRYNTNLTNYVDIKVVNAAGWSNLKLAKINIDQVACNNLISLKGLQENIASNYYNIRTVQGQIESTKTNLAIADTLFQISNSKFNEGLINLQDLNDSEVNLLTTEENLNQLTFLLEQYIISLKILCDIPASTTVSLSPFENVSQNNEIPQVSINYLEQKSAELNTLYAEKNLASTRSKFMPTLSLQLSNSNNLYNQSFEPLTGDWINSNYIGVKLNVPIPSSQNISQHWNAKYDLEISQNDFKRAREKVQLNQLQLVSEYQTALSKSSSDTKILALRKESYSRNQDLFEEGIVGLDVVLNSYNALVNAGYNSVSSNVSLELSVSKIKINNNVQ